MFREWSCSIDSCTQMLNANQKKIVFRIPEQILFGLVLLVLVNQSLV